MDNIIGSIGDEELPEMTEEDLINEITPTRAVRQGNTKKGLKFSFKSPLEADKEATEVAIHVLGTLPDIGVNLIPKQQIFIQSFYTNLFDVGISCNLAGVSIEQYNKWLQFDENFARCQNLIIDLVKSKVHSLAIKQAMYERDSNFLIKLLESYFPSTYAVQEQVSGDDETALLSEALMLLEKK